MIKVIFLCHGNICRSPIAEYIFKHLVKKSNVEGMFDICSRATSYEESGNDIYPPSKKTLLKNGIPYGVHHATRITKDEYEASDYVLVMEEYNIFNLRRIVGNIDNDKVFLLRNWSNPKKEIEDPWSSGNFDKVFKEIYEGCFDFLNQIIK